MIPNGTSPVLPLPYSTLARYLLGVYALLIVYASLHPFTQWYAPGVGPLDFLGMPPPRWITAFDVAANLLAYVPLGLLIVTALYPRPRGWRALFIAVALGTSLSLLLEALQNYLPSRIPSNLDLGLNSAGALLGALIGLQLAPRVVGRGVIYRSRHRWFKRGRHIDAGLVLIGAWLMSQLRPEILLFGNGDLRFLFDAMPSVLYAAETFVHVEAMVAIANLIAVALMVSLLVTPAAPKFRLFLGLLCATALVRTLAFMVLYDAPGAFSWLTPGARIGLLIGIPLALGALALPRRLAIALCGLLLMTATAMVNFAPGNPYLIAALQAWYQGHFLNFNGLTRLVSTLWPFLALGYLLIPQQRIRA